MKRFKNNLSQMASLDIFLSSRHPKEIKVIQETLEPVGISSPLLSMDLFLGNFQKALESGRKKSDLNYILDLDPVYNTQFDHSLILQKDYDALVLTDVDQTIKWVNKGFSKMTGYTAGYALGKTPKFLQGKKTGQDTNRRIRQRLENKEIFSEVVVNYRKNKEEYLCEITIIPLLNNNKHLTHFLAIEKEVA